MKYQSYLRLVLTKCLDRPILAAMPTTAPRRPRRRTQAERSASTRARLIDATLACLAERGFAGTTTVAVCERARVSHGSLLHHFRTRERLLGAALDAVTERLRARVVGGLEALPEGAERVEAFVDLMWQAFGGDEFKAVVELWLAAANDPDLSWEVWPVAQAFDAGHMPLADRLFPEAAARLPDFHVYVSLVFQTLQGMGLARATFPRRDEGEAMRARVRALLTRTLREAFAAADAAEA